MFAGIAGLTSCSTPMTLVGPQGHLSAKLTLPDDFDPEDDTCMIVASMLAGKLAQEGKAPDGLVLLAPGSIIKEATQGGRIWTRV